MGSNKNKQKANTAVPRQATPGNTSKSPISPNNPIFTESGNDERGRVQNRIVDEQSRYRGQMDPYMNALGEGFGGALERGQQDYGDIMSSFRGAASSNPISARGVSYSDPFESYNKFRSFSDTGGYTPDNEAYAGYKGFSQTGGYSPTDIADLRSRGVAPIRAAYANAGREVGRQRSLAGGYSPNATAVLAKMAREQGQLGADALQSTNAGIIDSRNKGQLSGLEGMAGIDVNRIGNQYKGMAGMADIENQRLNAQIDTGKFNANAGMQADQYNNANQIQALQGMSSLYGTTPGMANMFGDQLGNAIQNSGQQGTSYIGGETNAQNLLPGQYENTKGYINDAATYANPFLDYLKKKQTGGTTNGSNKGIPGTGDTPLPWE